MRPPRQEGPRTDKNSLNPAVTFGLCGSAGEWGGAQWTVYLPAQMVAAALAVGTYLDLHLNSKEDIEDVPVMKALWCCMPCLK